jgi:hypothetical protein
MKSSVFWNVTPCSSVAVHRSFGGTYCLRLQGREITKQELNFVSHVSKSSKRTFRATAECRHHMPEPHSLWQGRAERASVTVSTRCVHSRTLLAASPPNQVNVEKCLVHFRSRIGSLPILYILISFYTRILPLFTYLLLYLLFMCILFLGYFLISKKYSRLMISRCCLYVCVSVYAPRRC